MESVEVLLRESGESSIGEGATRGWVMVYR